jgi:hypothetical protein
MVIYNIMMVKWTQMIRSSKTRYISKMVKWKSHKAIKFCVHISAIGRPTKLLCSHLICHILITIR